jgi:hypothetical protein
MTIKHSSWRRRKIRKIEVLSEVNNTYRTLCSLFCLCLMLKAYSRLEAQLPILRDWDATALAVLFLVLFLFAHRKQTEFVVKRIKANER